MSPSPEVVAAARALAATELREYAEQTQRHEGDTFGGCSILRGDRCDITAALRVLADRIERQS